MSTTIMINENTRSLLKQLGRKDETYDQIINRLIKIAERTSLYDASLKDFHQNK